MCEWISVKEKLPELHKLVLCCGVRGGLFLACLERTYTRADGSLGLSWYVPNLRTSRDAIYWMEVPTAPIQ